MEKPPRNFNLTVLKAAEGGVWSLLISRYLSEEQITKLLETIDVDMQILPEPDTR